MLQVHGKVLIFSRISRIEKSNFSSLNSDEHNDGRSESHERIIDAYYLPNRYE
jgi:hypothetical protein